MQKTGDNCIWYTYDESGNVSGLRVGNSEYYYYRNGQGDIIGIIDGTGSIVAKYSYDAWGLPVAITDGAGNDVSGNPNHIANINPFRYRGYFYDTETGLYYLQSRYYDPQVGRFLNADAIVDNRGTVTQNLFSYCGNNPVNNIDSGGHFFGPVMWVVVAIAAAALLTGCQNTNNVAPPTPTPAPTPTPCPSPAPAPTPSPRRIEARVDELRMCTDGAADAYGSTSHQSQTAMSGRLGIQTPADQIPYIVIPTNEEGYSDLIGCMGVVINNANGKFAYAVVGDGGSPKRGYGEVSLKVAWDLGFSHKQANGKCGPEGDFTIIVFPGTRQQWKNGILNEQIQEAGPRYYP